MVLLRAGPSPRIQIQVRGHFFFVLIFFLGGGGHTIFQTPPKYTIFVCVCMFYANAEKRLLRSDVSSPVRRRSVRTSMTFL